MKPPSPVTGLLAALGWVAVAAVSTALLLPGDPLFRTVVAAAAVLLFAAAIVAPRASWIAAALVLAVSGASSLAFGAREPAVVAPVPLAAFLAGSAVRALYDLDGRGRRGLTPVLRAGAAAAGLSATAAWIWARSSYLLLRGVPPPRVLSESGLGAADAVAGTASVLAAILLAVGFHALALRTERDARGRRLLDVSLVAVGVVAGGVALAQRAGVVPFLRAERWSLAGRAQSTFTDPSAAGVAAALLFAPLLARAAAGPVPLRLAAGLGAGSLLVLVADAGSRAGFIGTLASGLLFVLWALTRLAAGDRPGLRRRVVSTVGTLAILAALVFAALLAWPAPRGHASLLARLEASFEPAGTSPESAADRLVLYESAFVLFRQSPIAGCGLGTFRVRVPDVAASLGKVAPSDHPPSLYLGVLSEMGLSGGLLLAVLLGLLLPALGRALAFREARTEEALRSAGAAASLVGLLVVLLFGSHLVYPEIAVLAALLAARLPFPDDDTAARLVGAVLPVAVAASSVLLAGGIVSQAIDTWGPGAAFAHAPSAGVFPVEREPDGRPFRWTASAAAFRLDGPDGPSVASLAVRNARPDGERLSVDVYWNDRFRGKVLLAADRWRVLTLPVDGPGVLRLVPAATFRPFERRDRRSLGLEVGVAPVLSPRGPG